MPLAIACRACGEVVYRMRGQLDLGLPIDCGDFFSAQPERWPGPQLWQPTKCPACGAELFGASPKQAIAVVD